MITVGRVKIDRRKTPEQMEKARLRARAWALANKERKRTADAAYRATKAEHIRAYRQRYYEQNKAQILSECRERYQANPEPTIQRAAAWARANPKKVYAKTSARRIARRDRLKAELRVKQRNRCAYCRNRLGEVVHIDHIMPVALGGKNEKPNYQLTCAPCNFSKNARHPIEFAQSLGRLL